MDEEGEMNDEEIIASAENFERIWNQYPKRADDLSVAGHRLAMELECLLLDCKDLPTVSKWFDSAHEALEQWRELHRHPHISPLGMD